MQRVSRLEKVIKKYTGEDYKVYALKYIKDGYAGLTLEDKKIIYIREDHLRFTPVFWHEMGHIVADRDGQTLEQSEYGAERWALQTQLQFKHSSLYKQSLNWIKTSWLDISVHITPSDKAHYIAGQKLVKEFK